MTDLSKEADGMYSLLWDNRLNIARSFVLTIACACFSITTRVCGHAQEGT